MNRGMFLGAREQAHCLLLLLLLLLSSSLSLLLLLLSLLLLLLLGVQGEGAEIRYHKINFFFFIKTTLHIGIMVIFQL